MQKSKVEEKKCVADGSENKVDCRAAELTFVKPSGHLVVIAVYKSHNYLGGVSVEVFM